MSITRLGLACGLAAALGLSVAACDDTRPGTTDQKVKDTAGRAADKINAAGDRLNEGIKDFGHRIDNAAADAKRDLKGQKDQPQQPDQRSRD